MRILEVNQQSLLGMTHTEAVQILRGVGDALLVLVCDGFDPRAAAAIEVRLRPCCFLTTAGRFTPLAVGLGFLRPRAPTSALLLGDLAAVASLPERVSATASLLAAGPFHSVTALLRNAVFTLVFSRLLVPGFSCADAVQSVHWCSPFPAGKLLPIAILCLLGFFFQGLSSKLFYSPLE